MKNFRRPTWWQTLVHKNEQSSPDIRQKLFRPKDDKFEQNLRPIADNRILISVFAQLFFVLQNDVVDDDEAHLSSKQKPGSLKRSILGRRKDL